ncbi:hypothetical protein [Actinacidiphila paucisporea]|uniref:Lipoprotein n=1 Tax=Actinacidiphila paucisporea TaxID=310782 RepID=A0A1M7BVK4_9ACTN|nr:hypothetical protein [Actinacidiphila paucisporea]SHL58896.1 hypothetical protein SAMN05216499_10558 [Actinacidiphila paucisporea]
MTWTPTTAQRAGASVAVFASAALLLAACSSGASGSPAADAKSSGSASASANASASGSMTAYRDCLSQHGVQLPSFSPRTGGTGRPSGRPTGGGGFGGGGFGGGFGGASADPKTQAAMQACESLRPQFSGRGGAGGAGGADSSAYQAFTSCLKDHGVTLPTSSASPGATNRPRGGMFGAGALNTSDPKIAKAYTTCKALLPQRPTPSTT